MRYQSSCKVLYPELGSACKVSSPLISIFQRRVSDKILRARENWVIIRSYLATAPAVQTCFRLLRTCEQTLRGNGCFTVSTAKRSSTGEDLTSGPYRYVYSVCVVEWRHEDDTQVCSRSACLTNMWNTECNWSFKTNGAHSWHLGGCPCDNPVERSLENASETPARSKTVFKKNPNTPSVSSTSQWED